jgi:DNA-binding transcriptional MerR regulator
MRFIQGGRRLGLSLAGIRTLLDVRDTGACPCETAETLIGQRIGEIDTQLAQLTRLRDELAGFVAQCSTPDHPCPEPEPGTWQPREEAATMRDCCDDCDCELGCC